MNTIINGSLTSTKNVLGGSGAYAALAAAFFQRPVELVTERETRLGNGKEGVKVIYRARRRLTIRDGHGIEVACYDGTAIGEATMPDYKLGDAHDMAIKTAETQALKRAAVNLGDQFGLSLYHGGSLEPLVRKVVGFTPEGAGDVSS